MGDEVLVDDVKTKADPAAVKNTVDPKADGALSGAEVPRRPL